MKMKCTFLITVILCAGKSTLLSASDCNNTREDLISEIPEYFDNSSQYCFIYSCRIRQRYLRDNETLSYRYRYWDVVRQTEESVFATSTLNNTELSTVVVELSNLTDCYKPVRDGTKKSVGYGIIAVFLLIVVATGVNLAVHFWHRKLRNDTAGSLMMWVCFSAMTASVTGLVATIFQFYVIANSSGLCDFLNYTFAVAAVMYHSVKVLYLANIVSCMCFKRSVKWSAGLHFKCLCVAYGLVGLLLTLTGSLIIIILDNYRNTATTSHCYQFFNYQSIVIAGTLLMWIIIEIVLGVCGLLLYLIYRKVNNSWVRRMNLFVTGVLLASAIATLIVPIVGVFFIITSEEAGTLALVIIACIEQLLLMAIVLSKEMVKTKRLGGSPAPLPLSTSNVDTSDVLSSEL